MRIQARDKTTGVGIRQFSRIAGFGLLLFSISLLGLVGCSPVIQPSVERVYTERQFSEKELRQAGVAVGGFVLADNVQLNATNDLPDLDAQFDHHAQSFLWGLLLDSVWSSRLNEIPLVPFTVLQNRLDVKLLGRLLARSAELRRPDPAMLREVRQADPGVRYLLLARVDGDRLEYVTTTTSVLNPAEGGLGRHEVEPTSPLGPEVRRVATVTLEMLDLKAERSVWEGRVQREARKRVPPHSPSEDAKFEIQKEDGDKVKFVRDEDLPDSPELAPLLEKCLAALFDQMIEKKDKLSDEDLY